MTIKDTFSETYTYSKKTPLTSYSIQNLWFKFTIKACQGHYYKVSIIQESIHVWLKKGHAVIT